MNMVEVKTADLIGPALDWVAAQATGVPLEFIDGKCFVPWGHSIAGCAKNGTTHWNPSADWAQGGPLIEKHMAMLCYPAEADDPWEASLPDDPDWHFGKTPLIAACRAIVAAKLGDVVSVPAELVEGEG